MFGFNSVTTSVHWYDESDVENEVWDDFPLTCGFS